MMNLFLRKVGRFFIKDGQSTWYGGIVAGLLSLVAIATVIGTGFNNILGWIILIVSGTVLFVFGVAGRAEAIGLKPFTNDPLGWRKAKKSYQAPDAKQETPDANKNP